MPYIQVKVFKRNLTPEEFQKQREKPNEVLYTDGHVTESGRLYQWKPLSKEFINNASNIHQEVGVPLTENDARAALDSLQNRFPTHTFRIVDPRHSDAQWSEPLNQLPLPDDF